MMSFSNIMQRKEKEINQEEKEGGKSVSLVGTECLRNYLSILQCEIKCTKSTGVISSPCWHEFDATFCEVNNSSSTKSKLFRKQETK